MMFKTRRVSINKRKTTRRPRRRKKGGGPKIDPSEQKKKEVKVMAQPLSFDQAAQDLLLLQSSADLLSHLGISPSEPKKIDPSEQKKKEAMVMAQPLSFDQAAHDLLLMQSSADHMLRHLGISAKSKTNRHDPLSATQAPLEGARARVMVNPMIDAIHASVDRLCARGDFANACVQLDRALALGSMRARVELADIMCSGRVGVPQNVDMACALLNDAAARRNPNCMGLRAFLQLRGVCAMVTEYDLGDFDLNADEMYMIQRMNAKHDAETSAKAGSKYGQFAYGSFKVVNENAGGFDGVDDMQMDSITAFEHSASDNYFRAQTVLGCSWYSMGPADDRSRVKAKRYFTKAAKQGYPLAMHNLGVMCFKESMNNDNVPGEEAMHWFNLAAAVPFSPAVDALKVLNEYEHDKSVSIDSISVVCNEWPGEIMLPDITSRY